MGRVDLGQTGKGGWQGRQCRFGQQHALTEQVAACLPSCLPSPQQSPLLTPDCLLWLTCLHSLLIFNENGHLAALPVQVLVATAGVCWGMCAAAKLVVVAGTQFYEGGGLGAADYPVTDLLQMLGRASRPGVDQVRMTVCVCKMTHRRLLFAT
jgi:hypothetical protein